MELAHDAVQARLAACAQVAGPVASTFWWEDGIERAEEWMVMLKLPADRYSELAEFLLERHSYDEPEIIATPIIAGSAGYLDWIDEETRPQVGPRCAMRHGQPLASFQRTACSGLVL